jgi:tryptophan-rich sensory protein
MKKIDIPLLIGCLFITQFAGIIGSLFTTKAITTWYQSLSKPFLNPPNWIFGPVWTILFLLMGISLYLILSQKHGLFFRHDKIFSLGLIFFAVQLVLNILWSYFFFYLHDPLWGLFDIILLIIFIGLSAYFFWRLRPLAGYILLPYLAWVLFATYLNYSLWRLN